MNSKLILLVGAILSSVVVFLCLKDQYTSKADQSTNPVKTVKAKSSTDANISQQTTSTKVQLKDPKLVYIHDKDLFIVASEADKILFDKIIKKYTEQNKQPDINFSQNIKNSSWAKIASFAINNFQENNITDAKIEANASKIKIYGSFKDEKIYQNFSENLTKLLDDNVSLENYVTLKKIAKKEKLQKDTPKSKKLPASINYTAVQKDINKILKRYPVYFKFDSDVILNKGKRGLRKIINIINSQKSKVDLKVEGHTDGYGNSKYNKILSQKRANAVKKYLLKHSKNINSIVARGYGSSKPKYKNPKDRRNRRVEIILLKGKK